MRKIIYGVLLLCFVVGFSSCSDESEEIDRKVKELQLDGCAPNLPGWPGCLPPPPPPGGG